LACTVLEGQQLFETLLKADSPAGSNEKAGETTITAKAMINTNNEIEILRIIKTFNLLYDYEFVPCGTLLLKYKK